jgi:membrane protease YdiL (CAAX protease family)
MASEPPFAEPADDQGIQPYPGDVARPAVRIPDRLEDAVGPGTLPLQPNNIPLAYPWTPPPAPQPGFWLGTLVTMGMFLVCQIAVPIGIVIVLLVARSIAEPELWTMIGTPAGLRQFQGDTAMLLLVSAHVPMILMGLLALRLLAGRHWYRQVALRFPSATHLGLLLLGFPALPILASGAYGLAQRYLPGLVELPAIIFSQLAMVGVISLLWLVGWMRQGHDPKRDLARGPIRWQLVVGYVVAALAVVAACGAYQLVAPFFPKMLVFAEADKSMEDLVKDTRNWVLPVAVLVIAVMPAFSEEIWCRAFLGRGLVGQYGVVCGILITSYFFGALHVLPHQGMMAMLMGLTLHYAYVTTRSLVAPMLLHFLNNATSVMGEELSKLLGEQAAKIDTAPGEIPLALYACAGLLMVAVGWALYQSRARLVHGPTDVPPWQPAFPGVALPPPNSGTVVSHPWPSLLAVGFVLAAFAAFAGVFALASLGYPLR